MTTALDQETEVDQIDDLAFVTMMGRLNRLSVDKHFDAYADIAWDDAELALDSTDPRLRLPASDPVASTDWYRGLTATEQAEVGLYRLAACMKMGWQFENLLQRGLLTYAFRLGNGDPSFRYLHHEVIEESQHTLMFQELTNRSGLPVRGMAGTVRFLAEVAIFRLVKVDPAMFFVFVLGGEDPVDHLQRTMLRDGVPHPLVERIMRIHVTEEARHLSFARHVLKRQVPRSGAVRRTALSLVAPVVMGAMARMMLRPPADLRRHCDMPRSAVRQAFRSAEGRRLLKESVGKTRKLCTELGLMTRAARMLWKAFGIWEEPVPATSAASSGSAAA